MVTIHKKADILRRIFNRIKNYNKNYLAIVCGETGSGKSYVALRMGEMLDKTFTIDRVVFSAEDFMKLLNSGKLKKGMVIIWDEAGVGIPSKEWWTISNKAVNYVLQTFRRENLIVIFTTPNFGYIDKTTRLLFHAYIETMKIDFKRKQCLVKYMNLQNNPRYGKGYFKYDRSNIGKKKKTRVNLPSSNLIRDYEKRKYDFSKKLYTEVEGDLRNIREGNEVRKLTADEMARLVEKKKNFFTKEYKGRKYIDVFLIMNNFDIGRTKAMQVKKIVESEMPL